MRVASCDVVMERRSGSGRGVDGGKEEGWEEEDGEEGCGNEEDGKDEDREGEGQGRRDGEEGGCSI